jgi:signal transduction histidine kinase
MLKANNQRLQTGGLLLLGACAMITLIVYLKAPILNRLHRQMYKLRTDGIDTWQSFGGTWDVQRGIIHNNSDERGAKLMSGSVDWQDYTFQADLKFDGEHGDMGMVIRSNSEEEGVDAYNGYYVGLRTTDGTVVIGRSDYGWSEAMPVTMPGGVHAKIWYRLLVTAVGCNLVASSENLATGQKAWMAFSERHCARSGRIGLRSLGTGGTWQNVRVSGASEADYLSIATHAGPAEQPEFPAREADYTRRFRFLPRVMDPEISPGQAVMSTHIADLQNLPRTQQTKVLLRGVVTLTSPDLYVEDSSGGAVVREPQGPPLNVGDGVQVTGLAEPTLYSAVVHGGSVRVISSATPFPPFSVTPWQAASGAYDARFIEIEGHLKNKMHVENGYQVLEFYEGGEAFRALYSDHSGGILHDLQKNSLVRIRGVCVVGRNYTQDLIPFAVLLRSEDDVEVLAGPPWWTPWHIGVLFVCLLGLASLLQITYFRIQQWKVNAITQERERLAHDIHDTMAQSFAGIGYHIQGIRTSVVRSERDNSTHVAEQLGVAYQLVRKCHEEASRTISLLSSSMPDIRINLLEALTDNVQKLAGEHIRTVSEVTGEPIPLSLRISTALFQIGQEAISNAIGHASPTVITLSCRYERKSVMLTIANDGDGFEYDPLAVGFGIMGMQKRAHDVGGTLEILSAPGVGTRVCVTAKLHNSTLRRKIVGLAWKKLRDLPTMKSI